MRLLLRIIKSSDLSLSYEAEPVAIKNTVVIKKEEPEGEGVFEAFVPEDATAEFEAQKAEKEASPEEKLAKDLEEKEKLLAEREEQLTAMEAALAAEKQRITDEATANAKLAAEEIIRTANEEAEVIRKAAAEKGFAEGNEKSRVQAEKYMNAAAELISQATAQKEAYYISHKDELIETACYMAEKLVAAKLDMDKSVIASIAANAAKGFRHSQRVKISIAGSDISADATADLDFIRSVIKGIPDIEIEVLENASSGTVVLDNGSEIIDASVPTQLDFLKEIMENSKIKKTGD
ncbi:MAG: hypothetical protein ACI4KD_06390 [Oscillospiraceae bacterium]